jgi:hypothetical protein
VIVEEKLDGASVMLWLDQGVVTVGLRSGSQGLDRSGQLGPLRAWSAQHSDCLRQLLADGTILYAEWLYLQHSIAYDQLPSYLVGLDLHLAGRGFASIDERNQRLAEAVIATPPELARGVLGSVDQLERMLAESRLGSGPMEGLVVRSLDGAEPRVAKLVRSGFVHLGDEDWHSGRPRNRLADASDPWR